MRKIGLLLLVALCTTQMNGQEKVGDKWVDNDLRFKVEQESVRENGELYICIATADSDFCIENLRSGFEIKVYDAQNKLLWEGIGSGRSRGVKLPKPLASASYLTIKAFKPYVSNKSSGNYIHQDEPLFLKYNCK